MFRTSVLLAAAAFAALGAAAPNAKAVTLDALMSGGNSIVVGNTVYSNFSYGGTTPASNVVINSSAAGLSFTNNTGAWTTPSGSSIITYDVTVTGSSFSTVGLDFTATASGGTVASVGETITDVTNSKDYSLQVVTGTNPNNSTASVTLNPTSTHLHLVKSIDVASNGTGTASITVVDNTFTPGIGEVPVPEPATLALFPLGLAALALRRKFVK